MYIYIYIYLYLYVIHVTANLLTSQRKKPARPRPDVADMRRGAPHDGWPATLTAASRPVPWSFHSKYQLSRELANHPQVRCGIAASEGLFYSGHLTSRDTMTANTLCGASLSIAFCLDGFSTRLHTSTFKLPASGECFSLPSRQR